MNNRIRELAERAKLRPALLLKLCGTIDALTDSEQEELEQIELFAELIVRECADICMEMSAKCAGLPGDGALAKDCAYWIKEDFGIE